MKAQDIVVNLIALHGGELVGRTRMQKAAYLLHRCGGDFDLPFIYHHYGPYSSDLAAGCTAAHAKERIEIEEKLGRYGICFAIFKMKEKAREPVGLGSLSADRARRLIEEIKNVSSDIVLELAATIVFLREEGGYSDRAIEETKARKPLKATDERLDKALSLLDALGLDPEEAPEVAAS